MYKNTYLKYLLIIQKPVHVLDRICTVPQELPPLLPYCPWSPERAAVTAQNMHNCLL